MSCVLHVVVLTGLLAAGHPLTGSAQEPTGRPTFHASVDRVTMSATVRDKRGRPVTTLKAEDFHLLDNGQPQRILEFQRDAAPMSLAILADISGSMDVAGKRAAAREAARQLLSWLDARRGSGGLVRLRHDTRSRASRSSRRRDT